MHAILKQNPGSTFVEVKISIDNNGGFGKKYRLNQECTVDTKGQLFERLKSYFNDSIKLEILTEKTVGSVQKNTSL